MRRDIEQYHKSISKEFNATKDRVRLLIGDKHWGEDGIYKEEVFRKVAKSFAPETYRIGTGFICHPPQDNYRQETSTQLDVLITYLSKPTLFKDGDHTIVTSDAVAAIIEVKTKLDIGKALDDALSKLADAVQKVRESEDNNTCWAGLFIFDDDALTEDERKHKLEAILNSVQSASRGLFSRAINCVASGTDMFVRFWETGNEVPNPIGQTLWHSYDLTELAQGYFISNLVSHLGGGIPHQMQFAWFSIEDGKETKKIGYISLDGAQYGLHER